MSTVEKFKSTLNVRTLSSDDLLEQHDAPKSPLRRPHAKLRKPSRNTITTVDSLTEIHCQNSKSQELLSLQTDTAPHKPALSRPNSWKTAPEETSPVQSVPSVPFTSVPAGTAPMQYPNPTSPKLQNVSDQAGPSSKAKIGPTSLKSRFIGIFNKPGSRNARQQPVDNFTKWDYDDFAKRNNSPSRPSNDTPQYAVGSRAFILGLENASSAPSSPTNKNANNYHHYHSPYQDAMLTQQTWANGLSERDEDEEIPDSNHRQIDVDEIPAICEIDWSKFESNEQVQELLSMYMEEQGRVGGSPTDSGIVIAEEGPAYIGKGKGRAIDPERVETDHGADENLNRMDHVIALEMALRDEVSRQQQEWADRAKALRVQKEEELERMRQEEEDRARAEEFQNEEDRKAMERATPRDCVCCGEEKATLSFPAKPATADCEHPSRTCVDCMHVWIKSEFDSKGCDDLRCPECPQKLSYDDLQRAAPEETFVAYEKLLTRLALSSLDEFSWCLASNCGSGQLNEDNANYMDCVSCGYKQCLIHKCAWHAGETCAQYDYRTSGQQARDEEAATAAMIDSVSKQCPGKNCGWRIQKTDGCDHMTCKKCKFEFCWECRASHAEIKKLGNTAHENWCKFHSDNLETSWPFNMH